METAREGWLDGQAKSQAPKRLAAALVVANRFVVAGQGSSAGGAITTERQVGSTGGASITTAGAKRRGQVGTGKKPREGGRRE